MDISMLLPELVEQSPPNGDQQLYSLPVHEMLDRQLLDQQSQAAQLNAQNAAFGTTGPSPVGFGLFGSAGINGSASFTRSPLAGTPPFAFRSKSIPEKDTLPSTMDASNGTQNTPPGLFDSTTGEMDWANWDDLVRQFGTDAEQNAGNSGQGNERNGSSWGHGMGGGVIF